MIILKNFYTVEEKIKTGEIIFSADETRIIRKIYLKNLEGRAPETIWFGKDAGTREPGSQHPQHTHYFN